MNEQFYSFNLEIDEFGERIAAETNMQGRVISKDGIHHEEPTYESSEEEEWDDVKQEYVPVPKPIIPLEELIHVYYFQWRIDKLEEGVYNPKICIGLCRDKFQIGCDLSRQKEVYCINTASGDKFTNRKWKDYYNLDGDFGPKHGHFIEGTLIGVFLDMDRGIVNFFKDGIDLGQAFVLPELKYGTLYPFVQIQQICEISIFHPFVYPQYRPPVPEDEQIAEGNMQETPHGEGFNNDTLQELPYQKGSGIRVYSGNIEGTDEEEKGEGPFKKGAFGSNAEEGEGGGWFSKTVKGITAGTVDAVSGLAAAGSNMLGGKSEEDEPN